MGETYSISFLEEQRAREIDKRMAFAEREEYTIIDEDSIRGGYCLYKAGRHLFHGSILECQAYIEMNDKGLIYN